MNYFAGLDVGNSTVKAAVLDEDKNIVFKKSVRHFGRPVAVSENIIKEIAGGFPGAKMLLSGAGSSLMAPPQYIKNEIPALRNGVCLLYPQAKSLLEVGAQRVRYITGIGGETPPLFELNEDCAGGTGSFFEDQMSRLGFRTEDYSDLVKNAASVPRLSGRCSVFAKTDIIHRQQEGVPTADILLGLCYAAVRNIKATVIKNLPVEKPVVLGGGVVHNSGVVRAVKEIFELSDGELISAADNEFLPAAGLAEMARTEKESLTVEDCLRGLADLNPESGGEGLRRLPPLRWDPHVKLADPPCAAPSEADVSCHLGIDAGSTSTNLVLINEKKEILDARYLRTRGNPEQAVRQGLEEMARKFGDRVTVKSAGITGSGRYLIGKLIGADSIKDEITAQAKAAVLADPGADTVFEIGGQDSKYIQIDSGRVKDFQMNKICAAGTGSFLEEQAKRLDVEIENYGEIALSARSPVDLGERCTVFIESNISACLARGVETADILAGLCYSVIRNYLIKVVGNKKVGSNIVLQGGVCYNPAVVAAFQSVFGEKVSVSPYFSVSGAFGAAVLAMEEIGGKESAFAGFDLSRKTSEKESAFENEVARNVEVYRRPKKILLGDYARDRDPGRKTIGVPYVLVVHKLFPMIRHYFETLGYNVLLSPETDENIIGLSQQYAGAETCYPVKLIYGHMAWLAREKVDYIFLPGIHTMKHETSKVYRNYGCVYMQSAPRFVFESMKLKEKGITLLNPVFSLDFGKEAMAGEMIAAGAALGKARPLCAAALVSGAMAVRKHGAAVEKQGKELLETIEPSDKVLVMVTRTYGIDDPVLNMNIPYELLARGHKVITLSHLPAHSLDLSDEYENLYWPFGQHIVSGAKLIAAHPNLYAVYLTNHGCGPDSMISHLFQKEMGDKPFLNIEVDEHYSKVGVITRIEAFLSSLSAQPGVKAEKSDFYFSKWKKETVRIRNKSEKGLKTFIPNLYPYSRLIAKQLSANGFPAEPLAETSKESLAAGREITSAKEYLSFAALAGDVLAKERELTKKAQVILPQTEGSEADGMFPRVIYNYLGRDSKLSVVAKTIETLPFRTEHFSSIFTALLAGDVVLAAGAEDRERILKEFLESGLTLDVILDKASRIKEDKRKKILLVGDPYILYNKTLYGGIFEEAESDRLKMMKMPLTEYLLYMWQKRAERREEKKAAEDMIRQTAAVHKALGGASPFCDDFYKLRETAEAALGSYTGGNGAYRFARQRISGADGVIDVASMYENTQTILGLMRGKTEAPLLFLNFEGTNDIGAKEKLNSFLY